jgi:hypothetical protein
MRPKTSLYLRGICFILLFFLLSVFADKIQAQSSGPSVGYNIVNNLYGKWNGKSIFDIIGEHNRGGAVTVRLTQSELEANPSLIDDIQSQAEKYNLKITWQPEQWSAVTPEEFRNFWIPHLSQIKTGTISLFVEYNYFYSGNRGGKDYAQILIDALSSPNIHVPIGTTNFNTTNGPGVNPQTGQPMMSWDQFLGDIKAYGAAHGHPNLLNEIKVWSLSAYYGGATAEGAAIGLLGKIREMKEALTNMGVDLSDKRIIIPEAGLDPTGVSIKQRLKIAPQFAAEVERLLKEDSQLSGLVDSLTFLIMDDRSGKQYLMYKDENGNWVIADYDKLGILAMSGPANVHNPIEDGIDFGITKAEPFTVTGTSEDAMKEGVRNMGVNFILLAKMNKLGNDLKKTFENVRLPSAKDLPPARISRGYIIFYYCEDGKEGWPRYAGTVWFETPKYYKKAATATYELGDLMTTKETRAAPNPLAAKESEGGSYLALDDRSEAPLIMSPGDSSEHEEFRLVLGPSSCRVSGGVASCTVSLNGTQRFGHMWVDALVNGEVKKFVGINKVPGPGAAPNQYQFQVECPGGECEIGIRAANLDVRSHPGVYSVCQADAASGKDECVFEGTISAPMPSFICGGVGYDKGEKVENVKGKAHEGFSLKGIAMIKTIIETITDAAGQVIEMIRDKLIKKTYRVYPTVFTPYTNAAEAKLTGEVSLPFLLPETVIRKKHADSEIVLEGNTKNVKDSKDRGTKSIDASTYRDCTRNVDHRGNDLNMVRLPSDEPIDSGCEGVDVEYNL